MESRSWITRLAGLCRSNAVPPHLFLVGSALLSGCGASENDSTTENTVQVLSNAISDVSRDVENLQVEITALRATVEHFKKVDELHGTGEWSVEVNFEPSEFDELGFVLDSRGRLGRFSYGASVGSDVVQHVDVLKIESLLDSVFTQATPRHSVIQVGQKLVPGKKRTVVCRKGNSVWVMELSDNQGIQLSDEGRRLLIAMTGWVRW